MKKAISYFWHDVVLTKTSLLSLGGSFGSWQAARAKIAVSEQQVERLQTVVHDTRLLMEHGTTNYLQVLTARQSLLSAELNLVADRRAEIQSVIDLYHALGGGSDGESVVICRDF